MSYFDQNFRPNQRPLRPTEIAFLALGARLVPTEERPYRVSWLRVLFLNIFPLTSSVTIPIGSQGVMDLIEDARQLGSQLEELEFTQSEQCISLVAELWVATRFQLSGLLSGQNLFQLGAAIVEVATIYFQLVFTQEQRQHIEAVVSRVLHIVQELDKLMILARRSANGSVILDSLTLLVNNLHSDWVQQTAQTRHPHASCPKKELADSYFLL